LEKNVTVLRIKRKDKNFLIIDKTCLNETELSWGAKGLHAYLMGLPHDWNVHVDDLKKRASNGRDSTRALIKELKSTGYISTEHVRDEKTGKFNRLEYVIHELPEVLHKTPEPSLPQEKNLDISGPKAPRPGKPSPVNLEVISPGPGNPSPGSPAPGNPTLISIEETKDLNNQEKAAASKEGNDEFGGANTAPSAAAFSSPKTQTAKPTSTPTPIASSDTELRIGDTLTPAQEQRTTQMINSLSADDAFKTSLRDEVVHCLLSSDCFKACGRDFAHKLNAIRVVVQRGEWQRPSGMVVEAEVKKSKRLDELNKGLQAAHADATHFKRLCRSATGHTKATFEKCVKEAQVRITEMEEKLEMFIGVQAAEAC
jgi:hypothetical protein